MSWQLRTTELGDFRKVIQEAVDGKRSFVWFTVHGPVERSGIVDACTEAKLDVLNTVPVWFVLACPKSICFNDRERMSRSILRGAGSEEAIWRGRMFGYSTKDIDWYVTEVEAAWKRFYVWREGENG